MQEILSCFSLVLVAEIGDKTQLLSIILAARFRCFWPIFWGVLLATLLNHAGSAYVGDVAASNIPTNILKIVISLTFIILGLWLLVPDKEPENDDSSNKYGAFLTSLIAFFIAEMGDKTQFATITLGAEYNDILLVTFGTTLGMMAANIPAILLGENILKVLPLKFFRMFASILFICFGIAAWLF